MKLYWKENKSLSLFAFLSLIILLFALLLIYFNHQSYQIWMRAKNYAIHVLNDESANNWTYNINYLFKNAGLFLNNAILLQRIQTFDDSEIFDFVQKMFHHGNSINADYDNLNFDGLKLMVDFYMLSNIWIQLFTFFAAMAIIGFVLLSVCWLWFSRFWWSNKNFYYFFSYQIIFLTSFAGYFFTIIWWKLEQVFQKQILKNKWFDSLKNFPPFLWFHYLNSFFWNFNNKNFNDDKEFIRSENLSFSYDRGHNFFKHSRDVFYLSTKQKEYIEETHVYRKSKFFKKIYNFFNKKPKLILNKINFKIAKKSFTTILGPNGCGKSTLIKCLIGLEKYYFGTIFWNNQNMHRINRKSFAQNVSYFPQILEIPAGINVYDFVAMGRTPYLDLSNNLSIKDKEIIFNALKETETLEFVYKRMDELSGGQRQKVIIATILAQRTDTIILDEPTTYLDIKNQHLLLKILKELNNRGKTIITILHDLNQAINNSSNLVVMKAGLIYAQGEPKKIINQKLLSEVFEIETNLVQHNNLPVLTNIKVKNGNAS